MAIKGNKTNLDLIKELVKLIKENDLTEIEIEQSDNNSESTYVRVSSAKEPVSTVMPQPQTTTLSSEELKDNSSESQEILPNSNIENHPGTLLSPMVGTVYLAPEPDASPFVNIGDKITAGQTVLIVEAMKTLNQIPATKDGIVKRILVDDGTPVEFGSPLIIIE
ncbi:MAG: acetyl-CoA carboxylase biotin carboxyl carrier protein [Paracoccaceae bacterium]|nr:acetyl-CoA carboxylase biotin carboxyl carrier protein [Paracoccaceae bacterium]